MSGVNTEAMYHFSTNKLFLSWEFCSGSRVISLTRAEGEGQEITREPLQNSKDKNVLWVEKWYIAEVLPHS